MDLEKEILGTSVISKTERRRLILDSSTFSGRLEVSKYSQYQRQKDKSLQVRDDKGRRRFHGAFTGGFSAGYFNTVGSEEGFKPTKGSSSKDRKSFRNESSIYDYMDEEDEELFGHQIKISLQNESKDNFLEERVFQKNTKNSVGSQILKSISSTKVNLQELKSNEKMMYKIEFKGFGLGAESYQQTMKSKSFISNEKKLPIHKRKVGFGADKDNYIGKGSFGEGVLNEDEAGEIISYNIYQEEKPEDYAFTNRRISSLRPQKNRNQTKELQQNSSYLLKTSSPFRDFVEADVDNINNNQAKNQLNEFSSSFVNYFPAKELKEIEEKKVNQVKTERRSRFGSRHREGQRESFDSDVLGKEAKFMLKNKFTNQKDVERKSMKIGLSYGQPIEPENKNIKVAKVASESLIIPEKLEFNTSIEPWDPPITLLERLNLPVERKQTIPGINSPNIKSLDLPEKRSHELYNFNFDILKTNFKGIDVVETHPVVPKTNAVYTNIDNFEPKPPKSEPKFLPPKDELPVQKKKHVLPLWATKALENTKREQENKLSVRKQKRKKKRKKIKF
eukprot:snap_masked-scaffold_50-processed-gene-0.13-mRNA-1 protein AED:0.40 eAED:0.44 QI:0/-1/0/1/-1/1/1/0/561